VDINFDEGESCSSIEPEVLAGYQHRPTSDTISTTVHTTSTRRSASQRRERPLETQNGAKRRGSPSPMAVSWS